jgi:hypothetical protein
VSSFKKQNINSETGMRRRRRRTRRRSTKILVVPRPSAATLSLLVKIMLYNSKYFSFGCNTNLETPCCDSIIFLQKMEEKSIV